MRLICTAEPYTNAAGTHRVRIEYDDAVANPRTEFDNFTRMWCEHRRYDLGDKDAKGDLRDAIVALAEQQGVNFEDEYLDCPGASDAEHEIEHCPLCDPDGEVDNLDYNALASNASDDPEDILRALARVDPDEQHIFHLPLYLMDHGSISMSTGAFSCPWDSGQVGVIFITREALTTTGCYGANADMGDGELRERARKTMRSDVEVYDLYLTGQVYGFICETLMPCPDGWDPEEWAEHACHWEDGDSCWGFYGDDLLTNGILDHLDEPFATAVAEHEGSTLAALQAEVIEAVRKTMED